MRKLLVSDYDGTFSDNNVSLTTIHNNRDSSLKFISNGNIFAFASGRNFNSITSETNKYDLPYHYLVCNNGTSIFNEHNELLHFNLIPFALVIKTIKYLNRKHVILNIKYIDIFGNETRNFAEVAEVVCTVNIPTPLVLEEVRNEISFLQTIFFTSKSSQIHTVAQGKVPVTTQYLIIKEPSDKKDAVRFIAEKEGISFDNVFTIGNDFNDYGMLECYNGFKMIKSRSELELLDVPEVSSVSQLIKRIEG